MIFRLSNKENGKGEEKKVKGDRRMKSLLLERLCPLVLEEASSSVMSPARPVSHEIVSLRRQGGEGGRDFLSIVSHLAYSQALG